MTTPYSYQYEGLNVVQTQSGSSGFGSLVGVDLDELFMLNYGSAQDSVLRDALGSVVGLTDTTQTVTDLCGYATTHNFGTKANPYQFAIRENDFNNLYFMRNRYYLPSIARFISRDPASAGGGGMNTYAYAGDDPIDFNDPTGLDFGIPGLGTVGEYESYGNFPGAAEGFYGSGYGYGGVEVGLGIALPGIGVGLPGNDAFKGSRMGGAGGPNISPVQDLLAPPEEIPVPVPGTDLDPAPN